jgi:hypothetical protein
MRFIRRLSRAEVEESVEKRPRRVWRRRSGVFEDRGLRAAYPGFRMNVLDGGYDAPLRGTGLRVWHGIVALLIILGVIAIFLSR